MFEEKMIAPCGLDCSLCSEAHKKEKPCSGCMGPDDCKPEFCSARCTIIQCAKRKEGSYRFCDECPDFPCEFSRERESRYQSQYALRESPLGNLKAIREQGMDRFLAQERERWSCKKCGGVISVHTGLCSGCGKKYSLS